MHGTCLGKFFSLHAIHKSTLTEKALRHMQALYEIESEIKYLEPDVAEYGKKRRHR